MATGSQNLTTYYAKRIIGDANASSPSEALLQTGTGVTADTWILHKTNRATNYGIKYKYDYTNGAEGEEDQIEFIGKGVVTAWVQLDTGDAYFNGRVGIGSVPNTDYKLYVNGPGYFNRQLTASGGFFAPWIELSSATPFIDFHFNRSIDGYTSRIIESSSGYLEITGKLGIGDSDTSYKLYVNGSSYFNGNTVHNGIDYFANGTTYYINNSGTANLYGLTVNSSATFKNSVIIKNNKNWPMVSFQGNSNTKDMGYFGMTRSDPGDGDLYSASHHEFVVYSYNSSTKARLDYRELYALPTVTADLTEDKSYSILTTKAIVTTAQGGTGNNTFTASRLVYSNTATKLASTSITSDGGYLGAVTYLSINNAHQTNYRLYVNGTTWHTDHIYLAAAKHIYMSYNSTNYNILHNHNNGNVSLNAASAGLYMAYQNTTFVNWMNGRMELRDGCLSLFPNSSSYREGIRIHATGSWSDITLCGNDNTGNSGTSANSWFLGNNNGNFYITRNGSSSGTSLFGCVGNVWKVYGNQTNSKSKQQSILHIYGTTYGNTAADMISGTAGLFSWGDGGPQITFDSSGTPGGGQAGALIFTDNDTAATGASWHFVSNQSDWNVTSKRFHARTSISIGSNLPNTSYNLYVNGTSYFTNYIYIGRTDSAHLYLINKNWTKGTNPSSQTYSAIEYNSNDSSNSRIALLEATLDTSGNSQFNIFLVPNVANSTGWSGIILKKTNTNVLTVSIAGNTTVSGSIYTTKAGECGLEVNNTQATNPNQGAFIVGNSGNLGIYSRKHSKWVVYSDPNGNVALNGNAATATKATQDSDGNAIKTTYLKLSGGTMTGELYYNTGTATTNREVYRAYNNSDTSAWWFILRNNTPGTTSAEGFTELLVGNGKNSTTAWNASGKILLYNKNGDGCWMLGKYGAINGTNRSYIEIAYISCTQIAGTLIGGCTGNAATATRINGNLSAVTANRNCNVWVSDDGNPSGIPRYVSGFYINPSSKQLNAPGRVHAGSFEGGTAFLQNIELIWSDPYIDFHANNSSADYTARIVNAMNDGSTLTLYGSLIYTGSLGHSSSRIVKKDIRNITDQEAKRVLQLRPVSYKYQEWFDRFEQPYPNFGFIAEEVLPIMPELVSIPNNYDEAKVRKKEQRPISLKEESLIPYLVKIVQMQQKQIDELKHQIKYLTN